MQVFVFDPLWPNLITPENKAVLEACDAEIILTTKEGALSEKADMFSKDTDKILALNPDYVGWSLPSDTIKDIPKLKCIITQSTSYSWIDTDFATKEGIVVTNIRNFSTDAVADWATLMMLNVARKIPLLIKNNFPLNFGSDFEDYQGINLKGKKAGIIGLGNIGSAIAERCKGLGMDVCYWSQSPKEVDYSKVELEKLFSTCDVIFPCMADNEETRNIISDDMINSIKSGGIFVSIVPKYYNHDLLLERVVNKTLFGYAFKADPKTFSEYKGNIWAAPAYGWCTDGSLRASMDKFVQSISDAVNGNYPNQVN